METVGLKDLKARLSELVQRCRAGEQVIITDRGQEVAMLAPLSDSRQAALAMRRSGRARWNGGKPRGLRGVRMRAASGDSVARTVLEDRR
ncbi:MAG: type II toxin-antitoxin system prevent-host-death family antitoxin [Acidobacteriota bacterium]